MKLNTNLDYNRTMARCWLLLLLLLAALPAAAKSPAGQYIDFALASCDRTEKRLPELTRAGEVIADRYQKGGMIGFVYTYQGIQDELLGRAGGIMHVGFERPWKPGPRTDAEKANDVAIVGWQRSPVKDDLPQLRDLHKTGCYLIGFGPRAMPALAPYVKECDLWLDTGFGADDTVVKLSHKQRSGHANLLVEMLDGWCLTAEIVSALTRQGKMPTMWKSFSYEDGREWMNRYYGKVQFHDDYKVDPIPAGALSHAYLSSIRDSLRWFRKTQLTTVAKDADLIAAEFKAGRKTMVAYAGHSPFSYVGQYEDKRWMTGFEFNDGLANEIPRYKEASADGQLVLRLGYAGLHRDNMATFREKQQRVMLIAVANPRPEWKIPDDLTTFIDDGWAFGDACVAIKGYPIRVFPPSGIMQMAAYQSIVAEVEKRLMGWQPAPSDSKAVGK